MVSGGDQTLVLELHLALTALTLVAAVVAVALFLLHQLAI